jgi:hypothetical protein
MSVWQFNQQEDRHGAGSSIPSSFHPYLRLLSIFSRSDSFPITCSTHQLHPMFPIFLFVPNL